MPEALRAETDPLISELVVGGLRAYGPEPTRVPLAPLTLVFGCSRLGGLAHSSSLADGDEAPAADLDSLPM